MADLPTEMVACCSVFTRLTIVMGAFPLMLADEIIGAIQYEYLCKRYGISSADLSKAKSNNKPD